MTAGNLSRVLTWNRSRRAKKEALVDGDVRLTYEQLDDQVHAFSAALVARGVGRSDLVAILSHNNWQYVVAMLGIARAGAAFLPLNCRLHDAELRYIVEHSGAVGLIASAEFIERAAVLAATSDQVVLTLGIDGGTGHGWDSYEDWIAEKVGSFIHDADAGLDDLQRVLYTSGTTSRPKGVMITHGNVVWNQFGQIIELEMTSADRIMASAPFFHVSGLDVPGFATLYVGATMVLTRSYRGPDVVDLIERERVTGLVLAAQILYAIRDMGALGDRLDSLRWIIGGGIPASELSALHARFPSIRFVDCYGMTELTNGAAYLDRRHQRSKVGSQGPAFPFVDLLIVDETGAGLKAGDLGEIVIRGPKVTPGYWRDPTATAAAFQDGWFHSGDLAAIDVDGYLWFADRKKDMIKSGGENVASIEIETVLAEHPAVGEVAVIGVWDPRWDEVPKGFVVMAPGASVTGEELRSYCAGRLGKFKVPREIEIVGHLPRNDSGKVLKRVLRDQEFGRLET